MKLLSLYVYCIIALEYSQCLTFNATIYPNKVGSYNTELSILVPYFNYTLTQDSIIGIRLQEGIAIVGREFVLQFLDYANAQIEVLGETFFITNFSNNNGNVSSSQIYIKITSENNSYINILQNQSVYLSLQLFDRNMNQVMYSTANLSVVPAKMGKLQKYFC